MNKKHEIRYSELFYKDLNSILNYIKYELDNIVAANNLFDEVIREIYNRSYNPDLYERYYSNNKRKDTYYRIYIKKYIIFYIVKNNTMEVRRMLYSRQNLKDII